MSDTAIFATTQALRRRLEGAVGGVVHVGAPVRNEVGQAVASVFLFHIEVNAELRNEVRRTRPSALQPAQDPAGPRDALPLDLRYLITVFRTAGPGSPPNELQTLGQIIAELQARPNLSGQSMGDQVVRLTPEPKSMEELYRVWELFPQDGYRTSMVYLATPVIIDARAMPAGPPVLRHDQRTGVENRAFEDRAELARGGD